MLKAFAEFLGTVNWSPEQLQPITPPRKVQAEVDECSCLRKDAAGQPLTTSVQSLAGEDSYSPANRVWEGGETDEAYTHSCSPRLKDRAVCASPDSREASCHN